MKLSLDKMTRAQRVATYVLPKALTLSVLPSVRVAILPNTTCLAVVVYGTHIGSTIGLALTTMTRSRLFLTPLLEQILVGILLGDAYIRRSNSKANPNINHKQGFVHLEYILWLNIMLSPICSLRPALRLRRDGSAFLDFTTRSLPCLVPLYNLFVRDGVKVITMALLDYITPVSLAY